MNRELILILQEIAKASLYTREAKIATLGHKNISHDQCRNIIKTRICLQDADYSTTQLKLIPCESCPLAADIRGYADSLLEVRYI